MLLAQNRVIERARVMLDKQWTHRRMRSGSTVRLNVAVSRPPREIPRWAEVVKAGRVKAD